MYKLPYKLYSFQEASSYGEGFPDSGIKCKKCGTYVPQFEGFGEQEKGEWKDILETHGDEKADEFLMTVTGCNARWAKIWRVHPHGALQKDPEFSAGTACPYCGKALRTTVAKQCPYCFQSWRKN